MARKAHVRRFFAKTKGSDELNKDSYIDMMRLEEFPSTWRMGDTEVKTLLKWRDEEVSDPEAYVDPDPQSRETELLKITDPQNPPDNPDDPDEYIPVRLLKKIRIRENGQEVFYNFRNAADDKSDPPSKRKINKKRVKNAPTDDNDDELNKGNNVSIAQYRRDETQKDDSNYIDQEVMKSFPSFRNGHNGINSGSTNASVGQRVDGYFNSTVYDVGGSFPQDDTPETNDDGTAPKPVRLDPLQSIVNVQLGGATEFGFAPRDFNGGGMFTATDLTGDGSIDGLIKGDKAKDTFKLLVDIYAQINWKGALKASNEAGFILPLCQIITDNTTSDVFNPSSDPDVQENYFSATLAFNVSVQFAPPDQVFFNILWESKPVTLNDAYDAIIDIGVPHSIPSITGGDDAPVIVAFKNAPNIKVQPAKVRVQFLAFSDTIDMALVRDNPFHLLVSLDVSKPETWSRIAPIRYEPGPEGLYNVDNDPSGADTDILTSPVLGIWLTGRDINTQPGNSFNIVDGEQEANETNVRMVSGIITFAEAPGIGDSDSLEPWHYVPQSNDNYTQTILDTPAGFFGPSDPAEDEFTDVTPTGFAQVPTRNAQKIPLQGMRIGVPYAYINSPEFKKPDKPLDNSIIVQHVQIWSDIAPMDGSPGVFVDDKGNALPTSASRKVYGDPLWCFEGSPGAFLKNSKGIAGGEFSKNGPIKAHARLRKKS